MKLLQINKKYLDTSFCFPTVHLDLVQVGSWFCFFYWDSCHKCVYYHLIQVKYQDLIQSIAMINLIPWCSLGAVYFHCFFEAILVCSITIFYITHLQVDVLISGMCVYLRVWDCFIVHSGAWENLIFQCSTATVSSSSPYKQTHSCLQMKTNIDGIKLGKEYLISELNVWIKLGLSL